MGTSVGTAVLTPSKALKFMKSMADEVGFEPTIRFHVYTLSRRAPSTARPPVQCAPIRQGIATLQPALSSVRNRPSLWCGGETAARPDGMRMTAQRQAGATGVSACPPWLRPSEPAGARPFTWALGCSRLLLLPAAAVSWPVIGIRIGDAGSPASLHPLGGGGKGRCQHRRCRRQIQHEESTFQAGLIGWFGHGVSFALGGPGDRLAA